MPRKLTVTARPIFFSAPQSSDRLGRRISGKAPGHRGWVYSQTRSTGPNGQLPLHLFGPTKTSAKDLARSHVRSASALSALKKVWSPTCPLNGSFHSPNCPLKGFFSLAKRDFLVANGRMAADFSSPGAKSEHPSRPRVD